MCKKPDLTFHWLERSVTFPDDWGELDYRIEPNPDGGEILLSSEVVGGDNLFYFFDGFLFCTDQFREFVLGHKWSNIMFLKCGRIV
ncbi:MAG: hypothetical protein P4L46_21840 [Fimbriimonas sp.]|nr:hypothetical protein [Fimbriimonas sp.]